MCDKAAVQGFFYLVPCGIINISEFLQMNFVSAMDHELMGSDCLSTVMALMQINSKQSPLRAPS